MAKGRINPFAAIAKKKMELQKNEHSVEKIETVNEKEEKEPQAETVVEHVIDGLRGGGDNTNIKVQEAITPTIKKAKKLNVESEIRNISTENNLSSRTKTIHVNATVWNKLRKQMVLMDVEKSIQQVTEDALSYYVDNVIMKGKHTN